MTARRKGIKWAEEPLARFSSEYLAKRHGVSVQTVLSARKRLMISEPNWSTIEDPLPPCRHVKMVRDAATAVVLARDWHRQNSPNTWQEPTGKQVLACMAMLSRVRWTAGTGYGVGAYAFKHVVEYMGDDGHPSYVPMTAAIVAAFALGVSVSSDGQLGVMKRDGERLRMLGLAHRGRRLAW